MNNREKLQCFYEAVTKGDRVAAESVMHSDFTIHEAEGLPYAGVYKGKETWWKLFARIGTIWTEMKIDSLSIIGEPGGNEFAWYMRMSGKSAATGKTFDTTILERWVLKDGLLFEVRPHYWDTKQLADANTP